VEPLAWWHTLVISALWRLKQQDRKIEVSLACIVKPYFWRGKNPKKPL
jgi:hypothetical protein